MSSTFSTLFRMQKRRFIRERKKRELIALGIIISYFWIVELILFLWSRDSGTGISTGLWLVTGGSVLICDFLLKLVIQHDNTVMDPFMKTRPVSMNRWEAFLTISQFWKESNIEMPLAMLPAFFMFFPFKTALILLVSSYLLSVFGGILVMIIKHRGNYQPEKSVSAGRRHNVRQSRFGYTFGLQSKSYARSKRLKTSSILLAVIFFFQFVSYSFLEESYSFTNIYLFGFIFMLTLIFPQYGLSVEAGYWSCLWTKPVSVSRLLLDKFRLCIALGLAAAFACLPICILSKSPVTTPFAYALFSSGFGIPMLMSDAYKCQEFDLFGKTFFNYQGAESTFKGSVILGTFLLMGMGIALPALLPRWIAEGILAALGIAGIVFSKPYFKWVERKFLADKYKYMSKFKKLW